MERAYAPDTGTPVPGGLSYNQVLFLLKEVKKQKKTLIGFDLVETACKEKTHSTHNCWNGKCIRPIDLRFMRSGSWLNFFIQTSKIFLFAKN